MKRPLVEAALLGVTGYVLAAGLDASWLSWLGWRIGLIALLLWALLGLSKAKGSRLVRAGLLVLIAAAYYHGYDARNSSAIPAEANGSEVRVEGLIVSPVEVDGDKVSFVVRASRMAADASHELLAGRRERLQVSIRLLEQPEQDAVARWGRGDAIALTGSLKAPEPARNYGGFDYRRYLYRSHIHWGLTAKGLGSAAHGADNATTERPGPVLTLLRWNDETRESLGSRFDRLFDSLQAGYMKSLVLGITEDFDPDRYQRFSKLGLTHVLAISGLHVAVFVAGCLGLLRLFGLTREKTLVLSMVLIPLYTAIAGGSPSVVRAGLMAMIALYAARRGILKDGLHILCAVGVAMLIWEPYALFNVSFQLSFIVTAGLIIGVPRFSRLLPGKYPALESAVSVTTVAQLISFPVSIYYFNSFSLLSWFANFLLVPFISFVSLPLGSAALMVSLVSLPAAGWIAWLTEWSNRLTFRLVDLGAGMHAAQMIWPTPPVGWIAFYFGGLALMYKAIMYGKSGGSLRPAAAASCAMIFILTFAYVDSPWRMMRGDIGTVSFLDVGQGDAILIRSPEGRTMLIDGGGTVTFRKPGEEWKLRKDPFEVGAKLLVPLLKKRGIHSIDYLVVSHQDADHTGGLQAVVEQIPVGHLLFNDSWKGNEMSRKLFETAMEHGAKLLGGQAGDKLRLDAYTEFEVLSPADDGEAGPDVVEEQNGASLVLVMKMFDSRFLFTGDVGMEQEAEMLDHLQGQDPTLAASIAAYEPPLDVLKIAHHGSKSSSSAEWLTYWQPRHSVISVGASNVYGHPNPQVLDRLKTFDTPILRTDLQGEIAFAVTRDGLKSKSKLGEAGTGD